MLRLLLCRTTYTSVSLFLWLPWSLPTVIWLWYFKTEQAGLSISGSGLLCLTHLGEMSSSGFQGDLCSPGQQSQTFPRTRSETTTTPETCNYHYSISVPPPKMQWSDSAVVTTCLMTCGAVPLSDIWCLELVWSLASLVTYLLTILIFRI